jgi:hypothetical protein
MRSSLASRSGSGDSFQVLVRWKVMPRRASRHRNASRPMRITRPCTSRRNAASFADGPASEGLPEFGWAGGCRLNDEVLVVRAEKAGTASRPPRAQAGHADLVDPVDLVSDGVLVGLARLRDHRDTVPAGRGQQHHRAPVPPGTAPNWRCPGARSAAAFAPPGRSTCAHGQALPSHPPAVGSDVNAHPAVRTTDPANLPGQSTSHRLNGCNATARRLAPRAS